MNLSNEHFRLLVESVQDYAIYMLDPDGIVRSWNAGAERLKGYRAESIIGRSFATFFSAPDRDAGKPAWLLATALRQGRVEDSGWRVRADGTQFWANVVITALHDAGTHIGFAKVTRDLTDRAFRAFVEATHTIVWTTDSTGRPNADSPSWRAHTGQTEAEWRAGRGWDPVHPDDLPQIDRAWTAAKANGSTLDVEFRLRRSDGEYVWMGARALPFRDADGSVREWFGVSFDISERKRAELERERALELLATTLRSIGDAVISTDADGRVTFLNGVAEQATVWSRDAATGRPLSEVFPIFNEETGEPAENPVDKVLREGVVVGLANHTVLRRKDGIEIPIDDSAAPIRGSDGRIEGVVLVFRDVTEEKRALYRRLFLARASEEIAEATDYRDALRRIAKLACPRMADWVGVDVVHPGTGKLEQLAVAHVDPAKIELARDLARRYPPDPNAPTGAPNVVRTGRSELYAEIPPALLEAGAIDAEHLALIRELDLRSAIVVPLRGRAGTFGAITFIFAGGVRRYTEEDVALAEELSQRVALLVERRRLEEAAAAANRMKDEFLATISHELRTPLQAILGYASMLERDVVPDPSKAISAIVRNAQAQARLVEDMLDMSRILSGKLRIAMARVDLAAAIETAIEAIRPTAAARNIRIELTAASDLGHAQGDSDRLQQVVWNLLSNAVKFSPRAGVVEVHATRTETHVQIVVRDRGKGIAPEHLPMIFERFRQVDSSSTRTHAGLGLGLAIVKYLVEAHGGTVVAASTGVGQGSTLTVTLPAATAVAHAPRDRPSAPAISATSLAGLRLLLVDDDDDTRQAIADALTSVGAQVVQASSADEALEKLQAEPPSVLLSDIGMPHQDGYTLIQRVRALPPERGGTTPAVALTAYARLEDIEKADAAGFQLHVAKPVALDQLIEAIVACAPRR